MRQPGIAEMSAFVAVAEQASFAKAARQLGVSRSTLSETIRNLEEKLGVRLLNRTTRSVALTEVGERLLAELRPALEGFQAAVDSIGAFRDQPTGHLRLTVPRPAAKQVLEPIVADFLKAHPAITLEVVTDSALTDIVRDRFDAGIRPGHRVERDMIALRVGEDARATLSRWEFEKRGKRLEVLVSGSLITSDGDLAVRAALDGVGIARVPATLIEPHLEHGRLEALLEDWRPRSVGFFLYYPSRRQTPPALQALIEALKARVR